MQVLSGLMTEYFGGSNDAAKKEDLLKFSNDLPVRAKKSSWESSDGKLAKIYKFKSEKVAAKFSVECIKHSFESPAKYLVTYYKDKVRIKIEAESGFISEIEMELCDELDYMYRSLRLEHAK